MDKKQMFFACTLGVMVSMGIGAGGVYLANYKKLDFMNRYSEMINVEKFMEETLEVEKPPCDNEETIINAYLALYGDKYTKYEGKTDILSKEFLTKETNESSVALGSGFEIAFGDDDRPYFSNVTEGMTADMQGIKEGDIIKSIDGNVVAEYSDIKKIRGEDGSTVKLIVERNGSDIEIDFVRACNTLAASKIERKMYGNTLYLKLGEIGQFMADPLVEALDAEPFDSLVLDLRDNAGGVTSISIGIADLFISEGEVVLHSESSEGEVIPIDEETFYDVPIVILVNENTASAAEILTALLKQYGDAELVGVNTFGKGVYQIQAMYKGGNLTYTDGYYTVGDWENYDGVGIKPDVEIVMDSSLIGTDDDIQLEKALEIIKEKSRD